jgi:hypothetical protein
MAAKKKGAKAKHKKKDKKEKKEKKRGDAQERQILGVSAKDIGIALAGTVAGELAQATIGKATQTANSSSKVDEVRGSMQEAAVTVQDALKEATPSVQEAIAAVKTLADDAGPAVAEVLDTVQQRAVDSKDTVAEVADNTSDRVGGIAQKAVDTAKSTIKAIKSGKKGKKKKG